MVVSSNARHSYIHTFESNAAMLSRVIFYLKSFNFLFLFSIYESRVQGHLNFIGFTHSLSSLRLVTKLTSKERKLSDKATE